MSTEQELTTADIAHPHHSVLGERQETDSAPPAPPTPASEVRAPVERVPLFSDRDTGELRRRWSDVQAGFVDEPRRAVEHADGLVADVMKRLAEGFANERASLEHQWDRGDSVTTEDLRVTLQRYRSFFDRLLAM